MPRPALLAALAALTLAACQEKAELPPAPDRPVLVTTVAYAPRVAPRALVGVVRARVEGDLGFRIPGKVAARLVKAGDHVVAGQPLASLDDADLTLQREAAEADLAAARSSLTQLQADADRARDLKGRGWATDADADRRRSAADEARGRVLRAERALALAANAAGYATLTADADGVVTATMIEPGQVVKLGDPHLRLARDGEREALVAVPETLVQRAREGTASVSLWAEPGRAYAARLRELSPAADPATRTFAARFTILDPGPAVRLGATATVTLGEPASASVARVPLAAVFDRGEGPRVWVVGTDGILAPRPVEVAGYEADEAVLRGGVAVGERVVALGAHKLDAGAKVRVVEGFGS